MSQQEQHDKSQHFYRASAADFMNIRTWEQLYNPNFKVVEFDHFEMQAGLPTFVLSAKQWIEKTSAVGIYVIERIKQLNHIAITQITSLLSLSDLQKRLEKKND